MKLRNRKGKRTLHLGPSWHIHFGPLLKIIDTKTGRKWNSKTVIEDNIDFVYDPFSTWALELWHDDTDEGYMLQWRGISSFIYQIKNKTLRVRHLFPELKHIPAYWWKDDAWK